MEDYTLYEQFIEELEGSGYIKKLTKIDENDIEISDDDESILVVPHDCHMISIRGIRESKKGSILSTRPHYIFMKIWGYGGNEPEENDAIRFSLIKLKKSPFPTDPPIQSATTYYHYPYKFASSGIKLKKGIVVTKDKRLEIKIIRNGSPIKFWKLELNIECDKWYKKEGDKNGNV